MSTLWKQMIRQPRNLSNEVERRCHATCLMLCSGVFRFRHRHILRVAASQFFSLDALRQKSLCLHLPHAITTYLALPIMRREC